MALFSQSAFLQALGWATVSSLWQMALLWSVYFLIAHFFKISAQRKYSIALSAVFLGFGWFVFSFVNHLLHNPLDIHVAPALFFSFDYLNNLFTAASVTYLLLLIIPTYRLWKSWNYIRILKRQPLIKADLTSRLFVKKVSTYLGINKPISVYVSQLVKSPVTIGYIKPIILLPFAAFNNLSTQQVEAVLLHELSHIKRYDYLVNFLVTVIHTLLYFNPFMKFFVDIIEAERENCCDEMVLHFQYDKLSYASALLILEKNSLQTLTLAAVGKKHLLHRIEKIIGIDTKPSLFHTKLAGVLAALLFGMMINAMLIGKNPVPNPDLSFVSFANPFYFFNSEPEITHQQPGTKYKTHVMFPAVIIHKSKAETRALTITTPEKYKQVATTKSPVPIDEPKLVEVNYNLAEAALNEQQKAQVKNTVATTKKVLATLEWRNVESAIADGMTKNEKNIAKKQYFSELNKISWKGLENNLKAGYNQIDWEQLNGKLADALNIIKLDSLHDFYSQVIIEAKKEKKQLPLGPVILPYPDVSVKQIDQLKNHAQKQLEIIKSIRDKKIIHL